MTNAASEAHALQCHILLIFFCSAQNAVKFIRLSVVANSLALTCTAFLRPEKIQQNVNHSADPARAQ